MGWGHTSPQTHDGPLCCAVLGFVFAVGAARQFPGEQRVSDDLNTGGGGDSGSAISADAGASATPADSPTIDSIFDEVEASLGEGAAPSDPVSDGTDPATPTAPATEAPQAQAPPETPPPPSPGEPPKERWPDILENTRTKTREEVLQHVVTQYGESLRVVEALKADPVGTVTQLIAELQADPRFAAQMASHAARTLRNARQGTDPSAEEPQADIDAGNGILLYSAPQQAKREAWLQAKWQRDVQQMLAPVQQDLATRQQRDQQAQAQQQTLTETQQRLARWTQKPSFVQHKDAIRTKQAEYFKAGHDTWDALAMAYSDVLEHTVFPQAQANQQQQMVAQAAQKLRAATPNPSTTAPAASRKARDIDDAFEMAFIEASR